MQSSTLVAFRTLVMLSCLAAVPAVAIVGGASWQDVTAAVQRLRATDIQPAPPIQSSPPQGTPPIEAPPPAVQPPAAPAFAARSEDRIAQPSETPRLQAPHSPFWPAEETPTAADRLASAANLPANLRDDKQRVVQASFEAPLKPGSPGEGAQWIQHRLKLLGAQHYRLLSWGPQGRQFRFECRMGLEANPRFARFFQATGDSPEIAMQGVLDAVEDWHRELHGER
jgi:hypothetical protein